jgi:hypothetical protein
MKIAETFFAHGKPVGKIIQDDFTRQIVFLPREGQPAPAARAWRSVDDLKAALQDFYEKAKPA